MPPKQAAKIAGDEVAPDLKYIYACMYASTAKLQPDWNRVAEIMGLTNPRSASNKWSVLKKKIDEFGQATRVSAPTTDGANGKTTTKTTTRSPAKTTAATKKTKEKATSVMKKSGRPAKKAKIQHSDDDDDAEDGAQDGVEEDEDENDVKSEPSSDDGGNIDHDAAV